MNCLKKSLLLLLILVIKFDVSSSNGTSFELSGQQQHQHCSHNSDCPTWFICNSSNDCQCGADNDGAVICDNEDYTAAVLDCYCVTYDKEEKSTSLGSCFFNCDDHKFGGTVHQTLPKTSEALINESVCIGFNRAGLLCGDCAEGHSPFVLSYNLSCVKCPDGHKNWWKFILAGFVPLTFFYFFVLFFNINVTTSRLHGVVWFSQALSMPALVRVLMLAAHNEYPNFLIVAKICILFYSFWNLDLLRSVIPDICLSATTLQVLTFDYLVALYPFLLIVLSQMLVKLYDSKVSFIVTAWKPFRNCLTRLRESMDVRTSIIDSFVTFFFLSYIKVLSVSCDLLVPTEIYQLGSNTSTLGLYYSPTVEYFGTEHLPYALLAIITLTTFVGIPTFILLLYPFQFFQRFLSLFPFNWHFLHAFVDSFQGCYKDGTEPGTFDCRWFAVVQLLLRPLLFTVFAMTLSMMFFVYTIIIIIIFVVVFINIEPFKKGAVYTTSNDTVFLTLFCFSYIANIARDITGREASYSHYTTFVMLALSGAVPIVYIAFFITFWIVSRIKLIHKFVHS